MGVSTHEEWVAITGIPRGKKSVQDWLVALVTAYGKMEDEDVESLSDAAFEWGEEGMKAKNAGSDIPVFFDYDEEPDDYDDGTEDAEYEDASEEDDDEDLVDLKDVSSPEASETTPLAAGPTYLFREILLSNYGLEREAICQIARSRGINLAHGSVSGILYHTKQTVELIHKIFNYKVPLAGQRRRARNKNLSA